MKQNLPIITMRLTMPRPRKDYVVRKALFEQLHNMSHCKVTMIKAGAGCDKTTLLASYIVEKRLEHVCYVGIDENMNQVFVFWRYVLESLKDYLGEHGKELLTLFESNMQKENMLEIIGLLLNQLSGIEPIYLVLDDFQWIEDEFLNSTILYFLENMDLNIHVVILTRKMPALYLGSFAMDDQLNIIEENRLRFTKEESREFLIHTLQKELSEERITALTDAAMS